MKKLFLLLFLWTAVVCGNAQNQIVTFDWLNTSSVQVPTTAYLSTDRCIISGAVGSFDYITFGDFDVYQPTGDEIGSWRKAPDHNATPGAATVNVYTKQFGSNTIYGPVQINGASAGINNSNVSCCVTSTGRVIVFWSEITAATATSDVYFAFSDNLKNNITTPALATWSSRTRLTTDYGTGALNIYIDSPGKCIQLLNGNLLKPVWMNSSLVGVYMSTNDGSSWTFRSFITTDSVNPCDETGIVQMNNGNIFAVTRCNSLHVLRTTISTDNGLTWAPLTNTTIQAYGKPAICQKDGLVFGISREYEGPSFLSNRTIYFYTTNLTTFTSGFIDSRLEPYMYGQPIYSNAEGKIIVWYATEGANGTPLQDPTRVIRKEVSLSSVTSPIAYDTNVQSWLDFAQSNGETLPSTSQISAINTFVSGVFTTDANLTNIEAMLCMGLNNTGTGQIVLRDLKKAWRKGILNGSPTYKIDGYDFNASTDYIEFPIVLSNSAIYSQNNASIFFYTSENAQSAGGILGSGNGSFSTTTDANYVNPRFTDNNLYYTINDGTFGSYSNSNATGFYQIERTASNSRIVYKDGLAMGVASSTASTGRATTTPIIGARHYATTVNSFGNLTIGLVGWGKSGLSLNSRFQTLKSSLGL